MLALNNLLNSITYIANMKKEHINKNVKHVSQSQYRLISPKHATKQP